MIAPVPIPGAAGGPIGAVIGVIVTVLSAIFGGGSGAGAEQALKAIEVLRYSLKQSLDTLTNAIYRLAHFALTPLRILQWIWNNLLKRLLIWLGNLAGKIKAFYEVYLKKYLQIIDKIRKRILAVYEKYVRPVLNVINKVRQVLYILRLFHVKFAEDLDKKLAQLESKITGPLFLSLRWLTRLSQWANVILTVDNRIQRAVFAKSLMDNRQWVASAAARDLWMSADQPNFEATPFVVPPGGAQLALADTRQLMQSNSGPLAPLAESARVRALSIMGQA